MGRTLDLGALLAACLAAACTNDYESFQTNTAGATGSTSTGASSASGVSSGASTSAASTAGSGAGGFGGNGGAGAGGSGAGTPGMAVVPAGPFMMGCAPTDTSCAPDELPYHPIDLGAFEIDLLEVTQAEYDVCVQAAICTVPLCSWDPVNYPTHPVACVRWGFADDYCAWVGKRLPTEAEWEKAARSVDGRLFPWGGAPPDCMLANSGGCTAGTVAVGTHPSGDSPYGIHDMAGNVWEWVADWYDAGYYAASPGSDPQGPASGTLRILRGGDFDSPVKDVRTSRRATNDPMNPPYGDGVGFRCAK